MGVTAIARRARSYNPGMGMASIARLARWSI
jgi:hypothetical protein